MRPLVLASQSSDSVAIEIVIGLVVVYILMLTVRYLAARRMSGRPGPTNRPAPPPGNDKATALVTVSRSWNPRGAGVACRVVVDGDVIGPLAPGRMRSLHLPKGPHEIHIEAGGRQVSDSLHLKLREGETVNLSCSPAEATGGRPEAPTLNLVRQDAPPEDRT